MLDYIGMQIDEVSEEEFREIERRILDTKKSSMVNTKSVRKKNKMQFFWSALFVQYFPNERKLTLKNSIHKFYNDMIGGVGPINHNDFNRNNLVEIANYISEVVERPLSDFKLFSKFEWGLNIDTEEYKPRKIFERYKYCVRNAQNEFCVVSPNKGKPFGRTSFFLDYRVKVYDKSKEANLTSANILRYEISVDGLTMLKKVLKNKMEITLQDIISPNVWDVLFYKMMDLYDRILKIPLGTQHTIDDLYSIYKYCDKLMCSDFKKLMGPAEFQTSCNKDEKVYKHWDQDADNVHNLIRQKMINKYRELKC